MTNPTTEFIANALNAAHGTALMPAFFEALGRDALRLEKEFSTQAGFTEKDDELPAFLYEEALPPTNAWRASTPPTCTRAPACLRRQSGGQLDLADPHAAFAGEHGDEGRRRALGEAELFTQIVQAHGSALLEAVQDLSVCSTPPVSRVETIGAIASQAFSDHGLLPSSDATSDNGS